MTDAECEKYRTDFGGGTSREWYVNDFASAPAKEHAYCARLGVLTAQQKQVKATQELAAAGKASADAARESASIAAEALQMAKGQAGHARLNLVLAVISAIAAAASAAAAWVAACSTGRPGG